MEYCTWVFKFEDETQAIVEGRNLIDAISTLNSDCHENIISIVRSYNRAAELLHNTTKEP